MLISDILQSIFDIWLQDRSLGRLSNLRIIRIPPDLTAKSNPCISYS